MYLNNPIHIYVSEDDPEVMAEAKAKSTEEAEVEEVPAETPVEEVKSEEVTVESSEENPVEEVKTEETSAEEEVPAEEEKAKVEEEAPAEEEKAEVEEEAPAEEEKAKVEEEAPAEEEKAKVEEEAPAEEEKAEVEEEAPAEEEKAEVEEEAPAEEEKAKVEEEAPAEEEKAKVEEEAPAEEEKAKVEEEAPAEEVKAEVEEETPAEEPVAVSAGPDQDKFISFLSSGDIVLNFDDKNKEFKAQLTSVGCTVFDATSSATMCRMAGEFTGVSVQNLIFRELREKEKYNSIYGGDSIMHLNETQLPGMLELLASTMKSDGILYMEYMYGIGEDSIDGVFCTRMNEDRFDKVMIRVSSLVVDEIYTTGDGDNKKLHVILKK